MLCAFTALCAACGANPASSVAKSSSSREELIKYSNLAVDAGFDTIYQYTEYGYDSSLMSQRFTQGASLFTQCNNLFDIYNDYDGINNIKSINDNAGIAPVKVDYIVIDMLETAQDFYEYTNGSFDITIGSLLHVWHEYRDKGIALNNEGKPGPVPSMEELQEANTSGWEHVHIDRDNSTVYIDDPAISLDVGGIAKGYAAEYIAQALPQDEIVSAIVNAGRNIRTINQKFDGSQWVVGIVAPDSGESLVKVMTDGSQSIVTSGDYERFYIGEDEQTYHHIIDPTTLFPANYYRSVTIVTGDSTAADCLSTALFVVDIEEGMNILARYTEATGERIDAVWVMDPEKPQGDCYDVGDYKVAYTAGLEGNISW